MRKQIAEVQARRDASRWNQSNEWDVPIALGITALAVLITVGLLGVMYFSG